MIWDTLVQLELYLLAPIRDIRIVNALDKHRPRMRVICGHAFWFWIRDGIERFGSSAIDKGSEDGDAFYSFLVVGGRHVVVCLFVVMLLMIREDEDEDKDEGRNREVAEFKVLS
jgi:hypothetical protein